MRPYEVAEKKLRLELMKLGFEEGESLDKAFTEMMRLGEVLVENVGEQNEKQLVMHALPRPAPVLLLSEPRKSTF